MSNPQEAILHITNIFFNGPDYAAKSEKCATAELHISKYYSEFPGTPWRLEVSTEGHMFCAVGELEPVSSFVTDLVMRFYDYKLGKGALAREPVEDVIAHLFEAEGLSEITGRPLKVRESVVAQLESRVTDLEKESLPDEVLEERERIVSILERRLDAILLTASKKPFDQVNLSEVARYLRETIREIEGDES